MKRTIATLCFVFIWVISVIDTNAQIRITGSECVVPGTEYQYDLYGDLNDHPELEICVEGGILTANTSTCYKTNGANYVRVIWNEGITKGKIRITSSSGKRSFDVKPTRPLQGGNIDSLSRLQQVQTFGISRTINCSPGRGGSCAPSFVYQWEQSEDNLHWTEIKGANFQTLSIAPETKRAVFVRRRVTDQVSNSIAYSDVAIVVVSN